MKKVTIKRAHTDDSGSYGDIRYEKGDEFIGMVDESDPKCTVVDGDGEQHFFNPKYITVSEYK